MSYKGLILKIQRLQATYDYQIEQFKENECFYSPVCSKENRIRCLEQFSKELDHILETEQYAMKKHFKY